MPGKRYGLGIIPFGPAANINFFFGMRLNFKLALCRIVYKRMALVSHCFSGGYCCIVGGAEVKLI